jgi:hypothetical protein
MGLFSSKKTYVVGCQTLPLLEHPGDPMTNAIIGAVVNDRSITDAIVSEVLLHGMASKADQLYRYGRDHYALGLPGGNISGLTMLDDADVITAIKTDLGITDALSIDYAGIIPLTAEILALQFLDTERGYNNDTGEVTVYPVGMGVAAKAEVAGIAFAEAALDLGITIIYNTYTIVNSYVKIGTNGYTNNDIYGYRGVVTLTGQYEEIVNLPSGYATGDLYAVTRYNILDGLGNIVSSRHWWIYDIKSGVYPGFVNEIENDENAFMPVIPLRYNNVDLTRDSTTDLFLTSKELIKKIGFDIVALGDGLNANAGIGDMDHIHMLFGVNLTTNNSDDIAYLVEFFDRLYERVAITESTYLHTLLSSSNPSLNAYHFKNIQISEHGLNTYITYNYITSSTVNLIIGKKGTGTKTFTINPRPSGQSRTSLWHDDLATESSVTTLTYQIDATHCKVVKIYDLIHHNDNISHGLGVTTTIGDLIAEPANSNFIIPIHYGIANTMPIVVQNKLYAQSLTLVVISIDHYHTKWYETGVFKIVVIVIGVVLAFVTAGTSLGAALGLVAGSVAFTVVNVIALAITATALGFAVTMAMDMFGIDGIARMVVQIIVAVMTIGVGTIYNTIALTSSVYQSYTAYEMTGIAADLMDMASEYELMWDELNEINDLQGNKNDIDPLLWIKKIFSTEIQGEQPESFFMRTTNYGNTLILKSVDSYCDLLLTLPTVDDNDFAVLT